MLSICYKHIEHMLITYEENAENMLRKCNACLDLQSIGLNDGRSRRRKMVVPRAATGYAWHLKTSKKSKKLCPY